MSNHISVTRQVVYHYPVRNYWIAEHFNDRPYWKRRINRLWRNKARQEIARLLEEEYQEDDSVDNMSCLNDKQWEEFKIMANNHMERDDCDGLYDEPFWYDDDKSFEYTVEDLANEYYYDYY